MKRLAAIPAIALAIVCTGSATAKVVNEPVKAPVIQLAEKIKPEVIVTNGFQTERFVMPEDGTWNGTFYECTQWGDNNESHMRCRTYGSFHPRLYYYTIAGFKNLSTGAKTVRYGPQQSVDGTSWGAWSSVSSPYSNSGRYYSSYRISWS